MYKRHSIWDEEQERQEEKYDNIENRGEDRLEYRNQRDYASGDADPSDVYNTAKAGEERKKEEETGIEKGIKEEEKKYEGKEEANEEGIKRKAASEVHEGVKKEAGEEKKKKKEYKSIEDAINKAMKEEKEVIYVDD